MTKKHVKLWVSVAALALLSSGCAGMNGVGGGGGKSMAVQTGDSYYAAAQARLKQIAAYKPNTGRAKNIILFVGDGMGISTVTAARIFEGQQRGVDGESNVLAYEAFPYAALSKTYTHDS